VCILALCLALSCGTGASSRALPSAQKHGKKTWKHSASVVSNVKTELLVLSKYDFYSHIVPVTAAMVNMTDYAERFYLMEDGVRRSIERQHRWGEYKRDLCSASERGAL